ncbi:MAG TPA: nucleotidyltransferase domain-containing protein [Bacteroidia bacterium]|nr:nucleotidyltransferase domain-containing protein [Bacteroidia bacterium]
MFQKFLRENNVFSKFGITRVGVFGSFARGEKNCRDIDLLIEDDNPDFRKLIELKKFLEENLDMRVDIAIKKFSDPVILYRAQSDMRYATIN